MALGDLITGDHQLEYNGLLLGNTTSYGIRYIQGLDLPAGREFDSDIPTGGTFSPRDEHGPRIVVAGFNLHGATNAALRTLLTNFMTATPRSSTDLGLAFQLPVLSSGKLKVNGRVRRREWQYTLDVTAGRLIRIDVQWYCADPAIYTLADAVFGY